MVIIIIMNGFWYDKQFNCASGSYSFLLLCYANIHEIYDDGMIRMEGKTQNKS
jgi:hypothetical protein